MRGTTPDCECPCHKSGMTGALGPCRRCEQVHVPAAPRAGHVTPEDLARWFHQEYERMAPTFGYETRGASAGPWEQVPEANRRLMTAVAASVLLRFFPDRMAIGGTP